MKITEAIWDTPELIGQVVATVKNGTEKALSVYSKREYWYRKYVKAAYGTSARSA